MTNACLLLCFCKSETKSLDLARFDVSGYNLLERQEILFVIFSRCVAPCMCCGCNDSSCNVCGSELNSFSLHRK